MTTAARSDTAISADGDGALPQQQSSQRSNRSSRRNVSTVERGVSVAAGGALALYALRRRDWLGLGLAALGGDLVVRGTTGNSWLYRRLGITTGQAKESQSVERSVTIERPAADLYRCWRNFENLPRFMDHLESVTVAGDRRSHWVAKAAGGTTVEWDAEITEEREPDLIAWRSLPGADVSNSGVVRFQHAPAGRGTVVRVVLQYDPPAGKLGVAAAKLAGQEPDQQTREDLRHFKQIMETGEQPTTDGQPKGH